MKDNILHDNDLPEVLIYLKTYFLAITYTMSKTRYKSMEKKMTILKVDPIAIPRTFRGKGKQI